MNMTLGIVSRDLCALYWLWVDDTVACFVFVTGGA